MCGRFVLFSTGKDISRHFELVEDPLFPPRFNIAPNQKIETVRVPQGTGHRRIATARWGLIPNWAKDKSIGWKLINARSETVFDKPAFRNSIRKRRCLIPSNGFYEWKRNHGAKTRPYFFSMADGSLFAFAGLWDSWKDDSGETIETCSIITTAANSLVAPVHERMPVILKRDNYDLWLDNAITDLERLSWVMVPYASELMKLYPVASKVNKASYDGPDCIEAVDEEEGN
jgi:putative SOS response-associated peptidase YedK